MTALLPMRHPLAFARPRPLWSAATTETGTGPVILGFRTDSFMDELLALLAEDPRGLARHIARPETWRTPPAETMTPDPVDRVPLPETARAGRRVRRLATEATLPPPPPAPVTLWQPFHQRHYVVAATLACAVPGLPDRRPTAPHEGVGFVVRRLLPDASGTVREHAFVSGPTPAWQPVASGEDAALAGGEELLPAFPLAHADPSGQRSMWGGVVPVGRRETYLAAPRTAAPRPLAAAQVAALAGSAAPAAPANSVQARLAEFRTDVAEPWKALIATVQKAAADIRADTDSSATDRRLQVRNLNLGFQMQSWLILADWLAFLDRHLPAVAARVRVGSTGALAGHSLDLFTFLAAPITEADRDLLMNGFPPMVADPATPPFHRSLRTALAGIDGRLPDLEALETLYRASAPAAERSRWPGFHTLLAGIGLDAAASRNTVAALGAFHLLDTIPGTPPAERLLVAPPSTLSFDPNLVERLVALTGRALPPGPEPTARPLPFAQLLATTLRETAGDDGTFRIRFVHLNPDCGPLHPPTVSAPTADFRMGAVLDPEAPVRPVRISLPRDTTPAALRRQPKGAAFVLSDILCGQVARARGLGLIDLIRHVLPWPLHKELDMGDGSGCKSGAGDIGMICSLSIPIVTLCALILLMIIVSLLDFIFRWLPWCIQCFPVPGLKAKGPRAGGQST